MSNLIEIKKRIESITSTIKVTKVMQMIATAKIAKIKPMMGVVERYENSANEILNLYLKNSKNTSKIDSFFEEDNKEKLEDKKHILFILFASDKGTCGSINTNIFKFAIETIKECQSQGQEITIFPVGKRAVKWLKTNAEKFGVKTYEIDNFTADAEYCNSELIGKLTSKIIQEYQKGYFAEISILSHKYKNIITCNVYRKQLLPIQKNKEQTSKDLQDVVKGNEFINIDESENTATAMIEFYIRTKLYNAYISNIASIVSSRMNAMDNATKNGQELIAELRIKYNKTRQANITAELSDIVSGAEALN